MLNFKRKNKFDKSSKLGIVFSLVAFIGISYELFFSRSPNIWLILGYILVLGFGGMYIFFL
jgi:hypothetical protein